MGVVYLNTFCQCLLMSEVSSFSGTADVNKTDQSNDAANDDGKNEHAVIVTVS